MTDHALSGVTVLDVAGTIASAYCGKLFADHGARVVNVERPEGHDIRRVPPFREAAPATEASAFAAWLSVNKQSVVLDWRDRATAATFDRLVAGADVLLLDRDLPAGSIDALRARHDKLVGVSFTWFGRTGPYADYAGTDGVCHALAAMVRAVGPREGPPVMPTGYQTQIIGGLTGYIAATGALIGRHLGNAAGELIDLSIYEANLCFVETGPVALYHTPPPAGAPARLGVNRYPPTCPMGIYRCKDGWVGVTALTPSQWQAFARLIGMPELATDPKFATTPERFAQADYLDQLISPRLATRTAKEWFEEGQAMRIPLALVPTMEALLGIDQYVERQAFVGVTHPDIGTFLAPNTPFRLFVTPPVASGRAPRLGEHTRRVLGETG
jgi:crotonobetainyl-CoA:carnitine CoA-transferase CaiB-like acyl-CoA transferase